ncbi:hypothetical protein [Nitratifractor sp.]|uniref:hypothetical protein n=1 Tax=Nitratifractor sp. TaxID=2268144 RepID=UPI0025CC476C|nr:hypothetical protein [Nitratifractor sp.]
MNFKRRKRPLLLLYPGMPPIPDPQRKGTYDLLLTPQLYLLKREKLPVRFTFQARRLAPSILEELGAESDWVYEAFKQTDEWVVLAYDPKKIEQLLQEKKLEKENIHRIYFAQEFSESFKEPLLLENGDVLVTVGNTVTIMPAQLLPQDTPPRKSLVDFNALARLHPSFHFRGEEGHHWLGSREILGLSLALVLLGVSWLAEGIRDHRMQSIYQEQLLSAARGNPTLAGSITRKNIYIRYQSIDRKQRAIRNVMKKIGMLLGRDSKLSKLTLDDRGYRATIDASAALLTSLKQRAASMQLPAKIVGKQLQIEGSWQ